MTNMTPFTFKRPMGNSDDDKFGHDLSDSVIDGSFHGPSDLRLSNLVQRFHPNTFHVMTSSQICTP